MNGSGYLVIGVVSQLHPSVAGRVRVKFPHLGDTESDWCSVVTPMGGPDRGFVMLPEPGDHVLVGFEHGDPLRGFVLGAIWNQSQPIPAASGSPPDNHVRFLKSRSGHLVRLDDTPGREKIEILDHDGRQSIVLDSANKKIAVTTESGEVSVAASSGKVSVQANEVSIRAQGAISIEAGAGLTLKGATVDIN